jgi:hypothetical protein
MKSGNLNFLEPPAPLQAGNRTAFLPVTCFIIHGKGKDERLVKLKTGHERPKEE